MMQNPKSAINRHEAGGSSAELSRGFHWDHTYAKVMRTESPLLVEVSDSEKEGFIKVEPASKEDLQVSVKVEFVDDCRKPPDEVFVNRDSPEQTTSVLPAPERELEEHVVVLDNEDREHIQGRNRGQSKSQIPTARSLSTDAESADIAFLEETVPSNSLNTQLIEETCGPERRTHATVPGSDKDTNMSDSEKEGFIKVEPASNEDLQVSVKVEFVDDCRKPPDEVFANCDSPEQTTSVLPAPERELEEHVVVLDNEDREHIQGRNRGQSKSQIPTARSLSTDTESADIAFLEETVPSNSLNTQLIEETCGPERRTHETVPGSDKDTNSTGTSTKKTFECAVCSKRFTVKSNLRKHVMTHISSESGSPGAENTEDNADATSSSAGEFECAVCNERFTVKSDLLEHAMIHIYSPSAGESRRCVLKMSCDDGEEPPAAMTDDEGASEDSAPECPVPVCALRDCVVRLERIVGHEDKRPADTRACNTTRTRAGRERQHHTTMELLDNVDTPAHCQTYMCDTCEESFTTKKQLVKHIMVHINESAKGKSRSGGEELPDERASSGAAGEGAAILEKSEQPIAAPPAAAARGEHSESHEGQSVKSEDDASSDEDCIAREEPPAAMTDDEGASEDSAPECPVPVCALRDCVVRLERIVGHEDKRPADTRACNTTRTRAGRERQHHTTMELLDNVDTPAHCQTYMCDTCEESFTTKKQLVKHIMVHINESAKGKSKSGAAAGGRGEGRAPTRARGRRHCCPICRKECVTPSKLKRHERTHTGEKPFSCGICSRKFAVFGNLKQHERTHTGERRFSCRICSQKFTASSSLKRHKRTHTGEKPFSCRICSQMFSASSSLKRHERTHTGIKPYCCGICSQKFTASSSLKRHKRTHSDEKPFSYRICSQKFAASCNLKSHEHTHTAEQSYSCDASKKEFTQSRYIMAHKDRIHLNQKRFCCDICQKRFAQKTSLVGHIRWHMSSKPR